MRLLTERRCVLQTFGDRGDGASGGELLASLLAKGAVCRQPPALFSAGGT